MFWTSDDRLVLEVTCIYFVLFIAQDMIVVGRGVGFTTYGYDFTRRHIQCNYNQCINIHTTSDSLPQAHFGTVAYLECHRGAGKIFSGHYSAYTKKRQTMFSYFFLLRKKLFAKGRPWPNIPWIGHCFGLLYVLILILILVCTNFRTNFQLFLVTKHKHYM